MKKIICSRKKYLRVCLFVLLLLTISSQVVLTKEKKGSIPTKQLDVLKSVEDKYIQMQNLQSELKKTTTLKVLQRKTVYTGTLKVKKGGYLRLDLISPTKSVLLINPKGTWHTQYPDTPEFDDKIRVIHTKTQSPLQKALLSILEEGKILTHFDLLEASSTKTSHTFKLNSKRGNNMISQFEVVIDNLSFITKITYLDNLQNKTVFDFHNISTNKDIKDDIFEFQKHPNAEIVEN